MFGIFLSVEKMSSIFISFVFIEFFKKQEINLTFVRMKFPKKV